MPSRKDELVDRRSANLADQIRALMNAGLKPEYRGFYGQVVLDAREVAELGELADVRKAARAAGRQLGWQVRTHVTHDGTLLIIDNREAPRAIHELAAHRAAEAVAAYLS
jgi:hypothetical protein